jgi:RimJ/RimL family protein N-acetyltransferase
VLRAADEAGLRQLTGKVHARNLGMRALYRKFGFEATHVTMEKRVAGAGGPGPAGRAGGAGRAGK